MQPYQRASESLLQGKRESLQGAAAITGIGVKGSALVRGINALLKPSVPAGVAISGLSQLNPYIKKLSNIAKKFGYDDEEVVDHMRETTEEEEEEPTKKGYFEQFIQGADLSKLPAASQKQLVFFNMILEQLQQQGKGIDDPAVKKIKKKIRDVLRGKTGAMMGEITRDIPLDQQQGSPDQVQQVNQPGQGQQALMQILQKIQQQRGM